MRSFKTQPKLKLRIKATLIDFAIFYPLYFAHFVVFGEANYNGGYNIYGVNSLIPILFWVVYFPTTEAFMGQTPGHKIMGMKVVDLQGNSITLLQAFKRRLLDIIDIYVTYGIIAILMILKTERHQRLGDRWAGTMVIGGEERYCENCQHLHKVKPEEIVAGWFDCPKCGRDNKI